MISISTRVSLNNSAGVEFKVSGHQSHGSKPEYPPLSSWRVLLEPGKPSCFLLRIDTSFIPPSSSPLPTYEELSMVSTYSPDSQISPQLPSSLSSPIPNISHTNNPSHQPTNNRLTKYAPSSSPAQSHYQYTNYSAGILKMPDSLLHEEIAQEIHEAGKAGRKARAEAEAEARENEKTVCT